MNLYKTTIFNVYNQLLDIINIIGVPPLQIRMGHSLNQAPDTGCHRYSSESMNVLFQVIHFGMNNNYVIVLFTVGSIIIM